MGLFLLLRIRILSSLTALRVIALFRWHYLTILHFVIGSVIVSDAFHVAGGYLRRRSQSTEERLGHHIADCLTVIPLTAQLSVFTGELHQHGVKQVTHVRAHSAATVWTGD
jgi:hypothetical protein